MKVFYCVVMSCQKKSYNYFFSINKIDKVVIVVERCCNGSFANLVVLSAESIPRTPKLVIFEIPSNEFKFTHALLVPPSYHGYLNSVHGITDSDRSNLYLVIPIFRCEFTGHESVDLFKQVRADIVPTLDWCRNASPRISVYFDNPSTGTGSSESGVILSYDDLIWEVEKLSGVNTGFFEITNYKGEVIEVISPSVGQYGLIRNRRDQIEMPFDLLVRELRNFLIS